MVNRPNQNSDSDPRPPVVPTVNPDKLVHSGKLGYERPPRKTTAPWRNRFGSTPLSEAPIRPVPDNPESLYTRWYRSRPAAIAGSVLALSGVVLAVYELTDNDTVSTDESLAEPSPSVTPSDSSSESPTVEVTKEPKFALDMLADVYGQPNEDQVEYVATHPVVIGGERPTPQDAKEAAEALGDYVNIYLNSGELDGFDLTADSASMGESMLDNIYGPTNLRNPNSTVDMKWVKNSRESFAAAFMVYPGLSPNRRWEAGKELPTVTILDGHEVWKVLVTEISSGGWDQTETPERKEDYKGFTFLATYETPEGTAWYHFSGDMQKLSTDLN
jgi:hypothetical protein